jgi:hypothetical protein
VQQVPTAPATAEQLSLVLRGVSLKFIPKRKRYQQFALSVNNGMDPRKMAFKFGSGDFTG